MSSLRRTPLYDAHVALGGRIVPFAGWELPVQYAGVVDEVRAVRTAAGIFDVSHMGQVDISGADAYAFLQGVLSNDLDRIGAGQAQYTLLPNEAGCPIDDLIAYRRADGSYLLVVNAGNREADVAHLRAQAGGREVVIDDRSDECGMIALQGPAWADVLERAGCTAAQGLAPFHFAEVRVGGVDATLATTGYTGERGCELICAASETPTLWQALLDAGAVPCGLGARDALRLEVCYPLHGNDITAETNALEAGLGWVCALDKEFVGAEALRSTRAAGLARKLVALAAVEPRSIPRPGCPILDASGEAVGAVTSGGYSPTLERGIGLGYVASAQAEIGAEVTIDIRGRRAQATVERKPLYRKETTG